MSAERTPGRIENSFYFVRNVATAIAGIALYLGNLNVAALAAIDAVLLHAGGKLIGRR